MTSSHQSLCLSPTSFGIFASKASKSVQCTLNQAPQAVTKQEPAAPCDQHLPPRVTCRSAELGASWGALVTSTAPWMGRKTIPTWNCLSSHRLRSSGPQGSQPLPPVLLRSSDPRGRREALYNKSDCFSSLLGLQEAAFFGTAARRVLERSVRQPSGPDR